MHQITELPAWERLFKRIVWSQIGDLKGLSMLDFGSGEGVTADHYAADNTLTAVEPSDEILAKAWKDHKYTQIVGDASALSNFDDNSFDFILCHNVLEYMDSMNRILSTGGLWKRGMTRPEEALHDPNTYSFYLPRQQSVTERISRH